MAGGNVTAEHDFIGSSRTITTTQVTTPLLPVLTPIDNRSRTYGKITAGVAATSPGVSAQWSTALPPLPATAVAISASKWRFDFLEEWNGGVDLLKSEQGNTGSAPNHAVVDALI